MLIIALKYFQQFKALPVNLQSLLNNLTAKIYNGIIQLKWYKL